jgi:hypothetical protein
VGEMRPNVTCPPDDQYSFLFQTALLNPNDASTPKYHKMGGKSFWRFSL